MTTVSNEQLFVQPVVKPVVQPDLTTGWMFVYTIQPVVKPVWQPVWQQDVSCKRGFTFYVGTTGVQTIDNNRKLVSRTLRVMGHGSWVTWVMGQLNDGWDGSWVTKCGSLWALVSGACRLDNVTPVLYSLQRVVLKTAVLVWNASTELVRRVRGSSASQWKASQSSTVPICSDWIWYDMIWYDMI